MAAALATQAAAQASAEQAAEDTYADEEEAAEIAANDAQLALADAQAQAWHDQVIALAQASNNLTQSASTTAAQLAAADAYFAAVGGQGVGGILLPLPSGEGWGDGVGTPDPLTPPGPGAPGITLTGDYGYAHPIGAYNVGDTVDLIDGVVQQMFKVSPNGEPSIGPQDIMSYSWLGAGGNMPYGPIANRIPTALNAIAPGGPQPQWSATTNPFGPQVLQDPGQRSKNPPSGSGNQSQAGGASNQPRTEQGITSEEKNTARNTGLIPLLGPDGQPIPGYDPAQAELDASLAEAARNQKSRELAQHIRNGLSDLALEKALQEKRQRGPAGPVRAGLSVLFAEVAGFWNGVTFGRSKTFSEMQQFAWEESGIAGTTSARIGQGASNVVGGLTTTAAGGALAEAGGALGGVGRLIQGAEKLDDAVNLAEGTSRMLNGDVGGALQAGLSVGGLHGGGKAAGNALEETADAVGRAERNAADEVLGTVDDAVGGGFKNTADDIANTVDDVLDAPSSSGSGRFLEAPDPRTRPGYDPGAPHDDHAVAQVFGGTATREVPAAMNLRKGGLEGELRKYEEYLISKGMDRADARKVILDEIESLSRDVIATPFSKIKGFMLNDQ